MSATLERLSEAVSELYAQAREAGEHEVAYHLLAARLHAAENLQSVDMLDDIERLAREHLAAIDAREPKHQHSSRSADSRGNPPIFAQLAVTAAAARARIKAELLQQKQEQKRRPKAPLS